MQHKYFYIIILLFAISCNRYDGPYIETTESYTFTKIGAEQKTWANNYLNKEVGIYLQRIAGEYSVNELNATFTVVAGGGTVDNTIINFENDYATTRWKSGNIGGKQQLRVDIINDNNELLNSIFIDAYAFRKNVWDTVTIGPEIKALDILADTFTQQTLMASTCRLYKQKANYFDWEAQDYLELKCPFSIHIDKSGLIYLSNWSGEIFKSYDHSSTWSMCTKPIANHPYFYYMTVTPDGYIWSSTYEYEYSLRCSRDGGQTWSADTVGLKPYDVVGDIFRLSNGDILFHSANLRLYKSTNDGKTWETIQSHEYSLKLYVTDKDEIIIFDQKNGVTIYKSTDMGETFTKVHNVWVEYHTTAMRRVIRKWKGVYYILIPGYGIITTLDFETFETFWENTDIVFLYMDHSGVLIAKELNRNVVYYYKI